MNDCPIVTLKNGLRVANFSSPHPFTFDCGTILPACDAVRCNSLSLKVEEIEVVKEKWIDIKISFQLTRQVAEELTLIASRDDIDVVLVPFPMLQCIRENRLQEYSLPMCWLTKIRVIRTVDRVSKIISSSRFCV